VRLFPAAVLALVLLCSAFGQVLSSQYTIQTFAGGGVPWNVPGTSASLQSPSSIAVDGAGNLFFAELDHVVLRLDAATGALTLVAGNGTAGFSGDNGPAVGAQLAYPQGVAVDAAGNVYIADSGNSRIRKVSNGVITTVAGGGSALGDNGPAASAQLTDPQGVAVDSAGNLYIADTGNNLIRRVSNGVIVTVAGISGTANYSGDNGPATSAGLNGPSGVAADAAGNLYIADTSNNRIRKISNGVIVTVGGDGTAGFSGDNSSATSAKLNNPSGVAVDAAGNLYIADTSNNRIRKVSNGVIVTVAGNGTAGLSGDDGPATSAELNLFFSGCFLGGRYPLAPTEAPSSVQAFGCQLSAGGGVAVNSAGSLYIADTANGRIRKVSNGVITTVAGNGDDNGPATTAQLSHPWGVAVDAAGSLYIADYGNNRIRKVSNGMMTTVAGNGTAGYSGDNGPATSAGLNKPSGVAVDSAGNLYIADLGNYRIRKVSNGVISTVAGNGTYGYSADYGPAASAQLADPSGIAVDSAGNLYIAEMFHNRVRKVANGLITTVAGGGPMGYCGAGLSSGDLFGGDNGPATSARLNCPSGIAVDAAGNLYIADVYNSSIRKVSNGVITTVAGGGTEGYSGDNGPALGAQLRYPFGVAVDAAGNVYIADSGNSRIREVSNGVITTVAGNGTGGFSGDNGPATSAELAEPEGVAVDSAGNVYIPDYANNRIRVLIPSAQLSTLAITTPSTLPSGLVGASYSQTLAATGGVSPYSWAVVSGALPGGLTLSSAGVIAGIPTTAGISTFGVNVYDNSLHYANQSLALTINAALAVTTPSNLAQGFVGTSYSQTLAATGGSPAYTWSILSGNLPPGLALSSAGVIAGTPTAAGTYLFTAQVQDAASLTKSQAFNLTVTAPGALSRAGVIPQLAAGGGWDTTIWLVNRSSAPVQTSLVFHGDDGSLLSLPLTITQPGVSLQGAAATLYAAIAPNTTLVVATGALASNVEGWADVLSSGALNGFAVFRYRGVAEAAVPLQSQIGTSFSLPFDHTGGYSTGIALVNLANSPANITATIWDENGNQLAVQSVALTKTDASGNGHDAFMLPDRLAVTAGKRGIVQFQGSPGSPFTPVGALTGLGLKADPNGLFTSIPTIVP
jgi:sugar lactone lactonase YvrE